MPTTYTESSLAEPSVAQNSARNSRPLEPTASLVELVVLIDRECDLDIVDMAERHEENGLGRLTDAIVAFLDHDAFLDPDDRADASLEDTKFLRQHAELRDLLEPMLGDPEGKDAASAFEERYLGDYRLVQEVGRGGMGVVYEADHVTLGRRVALKVLPAHVTLGPRQIERFRREAAAAAKLRHHAIVPIYDAGEVDGTYYFTMELVKGRNLGEILEDDPDVGLGVVRAGCYAVRVAEVVARVADALHYAHDNGVLHRDVKPHNILVGDDGAVRLVDFGLARDVERDGVSLTGEFAGTPHYASPEQIDAKGRQVDARTDVFSLGVVLYELLAEKRPFDGDSTQSVLAGICTVDPPSLRRVNGKVPRDLAVICHKALEKEPANRYSTAGELAADLRRFLRHETIVAQPPGPLVRFTKAMRRNRVCVAIVALLALIVIGGPLLLWRNARVIEKRNLSHLEQARSLLSDSVHALEISKHRPGSESEYLRHLQIFVESYADLAQGGLSDPDFEDERVSVLAQMAHSQHSIGDRSASIRTYTIAIQRLEELLRKWPDRPSFLLRRAALYLDRSHRHRDRGDWQASWQDLEKSTSLYEEIDVELLDPTQRQITTVALANASCARGQLLSRSRQGLVQCRQSYETALEHWDRLGPAEEQPLEYRRSRASILTKLGETLIRLELAGRAETTLREALAEHEAIHAIDPLHPTARYGIAASFGHLGELSVKAGDRAGAIASLNRSVAAHAALTRDFSQTVNHLHNLARVQGILADVLYRDPAMLEESWKTVNESVANLERLCKMSPDSHSYQTLLANVTQLRARILAKRPGAKVKEKIEAYRVAVALHRDIVAMNVNVEFAHFQLGNALRMLAYWQQRARDFVGAEATLLEAARQHQSALALDPESEKYASTLQKIHASLGRVRESLGPHIATRSAHASKTR